MDTQVYESLGLDQRRKMCPWALNEDCRVIFWNVSGMRTTVWTHWYDFIRMGFIAIELL